jgi:LmbE family N-acetylglucosaminyl deacetylase
MPNQFLKWVSGIVAGLALASTASASVLFLSPHPDDDVIAGAGVLHHARSKGVSTTVVYMTNGDYVGQSTGLTRQAEAVAAQAALGADEDELIFLGYPDADLATLFDSFPNVNDAFVSPNTGRSTTYGTRGLGSSDYHTYRFGNPAKYNRANMVQDVADILTTHQPDHIYTTDESDWHGDHATAYRVLLLAIEQVRTQVPDYQPVIHTTLIWAKDPFLAPIWPAAPTPLDPTLYHTEPPDLQGFGLNWSQRESLDVPYALQSTVLANNPKYNAVESHVSQGGANGFIGRFVHKDEFFWAENPSGANQPPRANAGLDQAVSSYNNVQLNGSGSVDPAGEPLTYTWTQIAGPSVGTLTAIATPSFVAPVVAADTVFGFELVVSDGTLESAPDLTHITIKPLTGNQPPSVNAGPDQSVAQFTPVTLAGSAADSDGTISAYLWTQVGGAPVTLNGANTATASFTAPATASALALTFSLRVTDNQGAIVTDTVTVIVTPTNDLPVVNAGPDQAVNELMPVTLPGSATDSNGTIASYAWTQTGGPAVTLAGANTASASFTAPAVTSQQQLTFRLTATDNAGGTGEDTVTVTVNPVNVPPIAVVSPAQTVQAPASVTLDGSASQDPDGDALSYTWTQTGGPSVGALAAASVISFPAPVQNTDAMLTFQLVVRDGVVDSAPVSVTVNVTAPPNQTPTANAGSPLWVKAKGAAGLQGSASDPDGSIVSYVWRQLAGPGVSLNNPNASGTSFLVPKTPKGTVFTFELTATDNRGATASSTVNVTVGKPPKVKKK